MVIEPTLGELKTHFIIPDPHAKPDQSLKRFDLLARCIYHRRPDTVVCMGDLFDFPSLCSYDRGKGTFEGRRVQADIEAGVEAQDRMWREYRRHKKKLPERIFCVGNHEYRLWRLLNEEPRLDGVLDPSLLRIDHYWSRCVPYRGTTPGRIEVDGILYSHFFASGVMGRPITMPDCGRKLVQKLHMSATCGDTHYFDHYREATAGGRTLQGMNVGCFLEEDEDYAGTTNDAWWKGVVIKTLTAPGVYDFETISMEQLERMYS